MDFNKNQLNLQLLNAQNPQANTFYRGMDPLDKLDELFYFHVEKSN